MKRTAVALVLLVIVLAVALTPASAAIFLTGNTLAERCAGDVVNPNAPDTYPAGVCIGYVAGVSDQIDTACTPKGVTVGQIVAVVKKYLNDHHERLHYSAASLVEEALQAAFPCKKKK